MALPATADLTSIPDYKYFYTCTSRVENCDTFDLGHTFYGDFGLNGLQANTLAGGVPVYFHVT